MSREVDEVEARVVVAVGLLAVVLAVFFVASWGGEAATRAIDHWSLLGAGPLRDGKPAYFYETNYMSERGLLSSMRSLTDGGM